jgi:hypothetical protein
MNVCHANPFQSAARSNTDRGDGAYEPPPLDSSSRRKVKIDLWIAPVRWPDFSRETARIEGKIA